MSNTPTIQDIPTDMRQENRRADEATKVLTYQRWSQYIYWYASGGLRVEEDGNIIPVSATAFAESIGVNRTSIYDWPKIIPNFRDHVAQAKAELYGDGSARMAAIDRSIYLAAVGGNMTAVEAYKRNHSKSWVSPTTKIEHETGKNLAELMTTGRRRKNADSTAARSAMDQPAIPAST